MQAEGAAQQARKGVPLAGRARAGVGACPGVGGRAGCSFRASLGDWRHGRKPLRLQGLRLVLHHVYTMRQGR